MLTYETKTNLNLFLQKIQTKKGNIKSVNIVRKLSIPPQDPICPTFPVHNSLKAIQEETNLIK